MLKLSQPLTKSIRTLEGVIVIAANIALTIIPILTNALSATQAVKYGTILNVSFVVSRSLLKGIAAIGGQTGITPAVSDKTVSTIDSDVTEAAGAGIVLAGEVENAIDPSLLSDKAKAPNANPSSTARLPEPAASPVVVPAPATPADLLRSQLVSLGQTPVA